MGIKTLNRPNTPVVSSRKKKYATDTVYREKAKNQSRRAYRRKEQVELQSCLYSLAFLDKLTVMQNVKLPRGAIVEMPVASVPETAKLLQLLYQTFWRWVNNGIVPRPVIMTTKDRLRPFPVYHKEEIRILIEEIGAHQEVIRYLRKDHKEVRERIEQRFTKIRKTLNIK